MLANCSKALKNKLLQRFGSLILFGSTVFGFSNQVFAGEVNINQNVYFQFNQLSINRSKKYDTYVKLGSMTIFFSEKIVDNE
ncbi:MAG: hypothetical protein KME29_01965 [Calothrix sp. FI2-JRJ7]|jgi:hypothetical protein|nr:hypothetical protein [Calothrix sp. FI2-JRJ7]